MYRLFINHLINTCKASVKNCFFQKPLNYLFHLALLTLPTYISSSTDPSGLPKEEVFVEIVEVITNPDMELTEEEKIKIKKIADLPEGVKIKLPDQKLFQRTSNRLFLQGYVANIDSIHTHEAHTIILKIRIVKRLSKIVKVICKGLKSSEAATLLSFLPCKKDTFLMSYHKNEAVAIIKAYFKQRGFPHIEVALQETSGADHTTTLCFTIQKGQKRYIRSINCKGNHTLSDQELKNQLRYTQEEITNLKALGKKLCSWSVGLEGIGHIWRFCRGTPFIEERLKQDLSLLAMYYQAKGFIDVSVTYKVTYPEKGYVDILLNIIEGPQYKIGQVRWEGNLLYNTQELNSFLGLKKGDIFNLSALQKKMYGYEADKGIKAFYEEKKGFLAGFNIKTYKNRLNEIDLVIILDEKPQRIINQIIIDKQSPTTFDINKILKQNGLEKDKVITQKKLDSALNTLILTDLFVPEKIHFTCEETDHNKINLICSLAAKNVPINFGIGLDGWEGGAFFSVQAVDIKKLLQGKKPYAGSQSLSFQFNQNIKELLTLRFERLYSEPKRKFILSFKDIINPSYNPLSQPIMLGLNIFTEPNKKDRESEVKIGGAIELTAKRGSQHDMSKWHTQLSYDLKILNNIPIAPGRVFTGNTNQLLLTASYVKYKINDLFYPMEGSKLRLNLEKAFDLPLSTPSLNTAYWRMIGTYSLYRSTSRLPGSNRPLTIKWQSSIGLSGFNSTSPVGRFCIGSRGEHLDSSLSRYYVPLRGYKSEDMRITTPSEPYEGEAYFLMSNIELRYALTDTTSSYAFLFADFACGSRSLIHIFSIYGVSCGIGFTTKTPLFVLGGTLAWPLTREKSLLPKLHLQFGIEL